MRVEAISPLDRVTAYETGLPGHHSSRAGGATPDPLIMDERFLAAEVVGVVGVERAAAGCLACARAGALSNATCAPSTSTARIVPALSIRFVCMARLY